MKTNLPSSAHTVTPAMAPEDWRTPRRCRAVVGAWWSRQRLGLRQPSGAFPLRPARQSGVALVATLIMLSLVTFMVVAFLGVARRERRSIEASVTQGESRVAMEAALARAQGDALARVLLSGDKWGHGVMVPTNFQNPTFNTTVSPTNVNHTNAYAQGLNAWLTNLANLQYDARVPVFSPNFTNTRAFALSPGVTFSALLSETNSGRFYLDFNRNGIFDPTDRTHVGDPHWLGLLDYPHLPHGPTNRFIGRYTYLIAPAGKALDLNLIHNQAKRRAVAPVGTAEGYYRNLGLGPHEFNLAALLTELAPSHYGYGYDTNTGSPSQFIPNARDAFRDALLLLRYRNSDSYNSNATPAAEFGATPAAYLANGLFDVLGNGPLMTSTSLTFNADGTGTAWPGGGNTDPLGKRYFDFNELFPSPRTNYTRFTTNLQFLSTNLAATVAGDADRRAPYRLMETLGVDSWPVTNRLNLNWSNASYVAPSIQFASAGGESSSFTSWHPDTFFAFAGEQMLRASATPAVFVNPLWPVETNVLVTNWFLGYNLGFNYANVVYTNPIPAVNQVLWWPNTGFVFTNYGFFVATNQGTAVSVTNIPIFPFSYYSAEVHRVLQLAANLYDATGPPEWIATQAYAAGDRVQRTVAGVSVSYVARNPSTGSLPPSANWETIVNSAATQIYLPTVWRPVFAFNTNGWPDTDFIRILGYTTNRTDATNLLSLPVVDLSDPNSRMQMYNTPPGTLGAADFCLVAGTPVIIGARKGYPNFNEFGAQTIFSVTRRLEFVKTSATNAGPMALVNPRPVQTNQSLIIGMTNIYGFEAWNSYALAFPRPLRLVATNITQIVVTNEFGPIYTNTTINGTNVLFSAGAWPGTANGFAAFKSFFFTNVPQLSTNVALGYAYATNYPPLPGFTNGGFIPASPTGPGSPSIFNRSNGFPEMRLGITITNSIRFALIDSNRVVDFVNLTNLVAGMDLATALRVTNSPTDLGVRFWFTNRLAAAPFGATLGISNQVAMCLDTNVNAQSTNLWRQYSFNTPILREIDRYRKWMGTNGALPANQSLNTNVLIVQSPFNPTRIVAFNTSWEANDPLVHYTTRDLSDPFRTRMADQVTPIVPPTTSAPPPGTLYRVDLGFVNGRLTFTTNGGINRFYNPWGRMLDPTGTRLASLPNFYTIAPAAYDQRLKDAGVFSSDMWDFPQRKFANLGWIGRVHRGTPWQTFYLKSDAPNPTNWFYWARSVETNPTNDWRLVDVFSAAINAEATRGLLSVNQTNRAAWAAALGGTPVLANNFPTNTPVVFPPASSQLTNLVGGLTNGLINAKLRMPMWQPAANYSAGDMVGYHSNLFGNPYYPVTVYYRAVASAANQSQNPLVQVSTNYFAYWFPVGSWLPLNYPAGTIIERHGMAYYSLQATSTTAPELAPLDWEAYPQRASTTWNGFVAYAAGSFVERLGITYYALASSTGILPEANPATWAPCPQQRSFTRLGGVLATPELSVQSPYLNTFHLNGGRTWQLGTTYLTGARVHWLGWYYQATRAVPLNTPPNPHLNYSDARTMAQTYWWPVESPALARNANTRDAINDVVIERIPQQTLGLMHLEENPRLVIYAWGQSLRPAERGVHVAGGPFSLMVTNYQITGESAARLVVRVEGLAENGLLPRLLPAGAPPVVTPRFFIESFKLLPADN